MYDLHEGALRRWSVYIRTRDNFTCYMCEERFDSRDSAHYRGNLDAHHIYPKALYNGGVDPKYEHYPYDLNNGISLCRVCDRRKKMPGPCHQPIVHTSRDSWRKWTCMFKRWVRRKANQAFKDKYQHRIDSLLD
jgi:hypothetical protein